MRAKSWKQLCASMDVDFFGGFNVILLEKKACNAIAIPEKKIAIMLLQFKNRTQKLDFLEIQYYANSVVIMHFSKIKHQNALCLFDSGKLRFPRASI